MMFERVWKDQDNLSSLINTSKKFEIVKDKNNFLFFNEYFNINNKPCLMFFKKNSKHFHKVFEGRKEPGLSKWFKKINKEIRSDSTQKIINKTHSKISTEIITENISISSNGQKEVKKMVEDFQNGKLISKHVI